MAPGVAPPRRAAAAWPNSWNPAENTVAANTSSSRNGLSNASKVAEARPFSQSTHQHTARNPTSTATTTIGANSAAKGAVSRRVRSGSVTAYLKRSASSGFALRSSGSEPSAATIRPAGRSRSSTSVRTLSAVTVRPAAALTRSATSSRLR